VLCLWSLKVFVFVVLGVLFVIGWGFFWILIVGWFSFVVLGFVIFVGGYFFVCEGFEKFWRKWVVGIEVLMFMVVLGAVVLGESLETTILIFLYSINETTKKFTKQKTRTTIHALIKLIPKITLVRHKEHT
jgi:Cation transport ATPase